MQALKIVAEGLTTSFRYPHFVQGVHPSFEMPPPATLYGHMCSAIGDYFDPQRTRFAFHFQYEGRFTDYEHLHFPQDGGELKPKDRPLEQILKQDFGWSYKRASIQPFKRDQLFRPRLTLYVEDVTLEEFFRQPRYAIALGRAQDLVTYRSVKVIDLIPAERAYYDATLLSLRDAPYIGGRFYAVTMPRFIDDRRIPEWGQYAVLPHSDKPPIYPPTADDRFNLGTPSFDILVDPTESHPFEPGINRGIVWHSWR